MTVTFTAVHFPEFPIIAWQREQPDMRGVPCAVVDGVPPQEKIVSLCERAKAAGAVHGMSKVQTETSGAVCFRHRHEAEEHAAFADVLTVAEKFSPRVEAIASPANEYAGDQAMSVRLLIDSSGTGTLFGSAESYVRAMHGEFRRNGFPAGIGSAPNAEAAMMLARSTRQVVCADCDSVRGKLSMLPVSLLPCEPKLLAVLSRWGIRNLGALAALPEAALVSRLGQAGRRLQQLARGEANHLLVPEEAAFTLSEKTVLDSPLEMLDSLLFVLSPLLEKLLRKAMERAYALRSVLLTLQLERGAPHVTEIRPAVPTQSREVLLKLLNLELQAHPPQCGIMSVRLEAEPTQPQTAQRGLFQSQFPEPDRLELLLGRLRSIAGAGNVGSPQLLNSHREDSFVMAPFRPNLHSVQTEAVASPVLAIRMFRPSQSVRVTCWGEQPRVMFWQGVRCVIRSCAGPWHASGSWWSGEAWDHDLWDVVTGEPVQALRLRHEHATKNWSVVGLYD